MKTKKTKKKNVKEKPMDVVNRRLENLELSITGFNSRLNCLIDDLRSKADAIDQTLVALEATDKAGVKDLPKAVTNRSVAFLDDISIPPNEIQAWKRFCSDPLDYGIPVKAWICPTCKEISLSEDEAVKHITAHKVFTGKSDVIKEVADVHGLPINEVKPSECDEQDFKGLPKMRCYEDLPKEVKGFLKWAATLPSIEDVVKEVDETIEVDFYFIKGETFALDRMGFRQLVENLNGKIVKTFEDKKLLTKRISWPKKMIESKFCIIEPWTILLKLNQVAGMKILKA